MIGETIGNFKIVERLGSGGMGEVYLAEQTNIGTKVAIKVLRPGVSKDTEHVQRFFNEARAVSKIQHAGIVKIFDVGYAAGGEAYLIMEYLEGETLSHRIETGGRLPLDQIADFGKQIASVLGATHGAGITHRDLKPDNIFIIADRELPRGERIKVLDFGIAKLTGTLAGASPQTIGTMGTPAYMAPEQWGDASKVDWRADVYSLGCVAFEMSTGRAPFVITTIAEACAMHLHEIPVRARTIAPELPVALDELLARLLEKKPEARPQSMQELARAFEAIGDGRGSALVAAAAPATTQATLPAVVAPGPPTATLAGGTIPPPARSRKPLAIALGVALAAGAGAAAYVAVSKQETPKPPTKPRRDAGVVAPRPVPPVIVDAAPPSVVADAAAPVAVPADAPAAPPPDAGLIKHPPPAHGVIDRKLVDQLIDAHHAQLEHCAKRPATIEVKLTVEIDGFPTQVATTAIDPGVDACIVEVIEKLQFPRPRGGSVPLDLPLTLEGGGAPVDENPEHVEMRQAMQKIRPELQACAAKFGTRGRGGIRFELAPDGSVKRATILGDLADEPISECLTAAARRGHFAKTPRGTTINFPFQLK